MIQNVALTRNEKYRFKVISLCLKKKLTNKEAAMDLQRSIRQVQGVVHGLKGKPSNHRKKKSS